MKIRLVSDLHTCFWNYNKFEKTLNTILPPTDDDKNTILCCAGDIGIYNSYNSTYKPFFDLTTKRFKAVVCVPGNHSYYNSAVWGKEKEFWSTKKLPKNVHYMDNNFVLIDDICFIGSTLWTNFNNSDPLAIYHATSAMNDFRVIKKRDYTVCSMYGQIIESNKLSPEDTVIKYYESLSYIQMLLDIHKDKKCVLVTHHSPSEQSVAECYKGDLLNAAYFSNLEEFIMDRSQIKFWFFGHVHDSFNFDINETKCVSNPYGYHAVAENKYFNKNLIFEL